MRQESVSLSDSYLNFPGNNRCTSTLPQHEVGIIEGTKDSFINSIRYYDNRIYTEQRLHYLNPLPASNFTVFARMKKQVESSNNFTTTGYLTLPELRIGNTSP